MNLDDGNKSGLYITAIVGIVAIVGMVFLFSEKSYVSPSQSAEIMTADSGDVAGEAYWRTLAEKPEKSICYKALVCNNSTGNFTGNLTNSSIICHYNVVCY